MRDLWAKAFRHKLVTALFAASGALIGGGCLWTWSRLRGATHPLILHFNDLVRINETGEPRDLLALGGFAAVVAAVNFALALELESRDWFLGKLVAFGTLAFALLIFIGFMAILSVN